MEEKNKTIKNPVSMKVHPDFKSLVIEIQNNRIQEGKETVQDKIPLYKLTKSITNLIFANQKIKKMLIEVEIKKQ